MQVHGSGAFGEKSQSSTAHVDAVDKTTNRQSKVNAYQKIYGEGGSDTNNVISHGKISLVTNTQGALLFLHKQFNHCRHRVPQQNRSGWHFYRERARN